MDVVVLLADAAQRRTNFLVLFVAELPRWDHIVRLQKGVLGYK